MDTSHPLGWMHLAMVELNLILSEYTAFEARVQAYTSGHFRSYCSVCTDVCCKPEFCRETLDSPFLALVRTHRPTASFSTTTGWLSPTGCRLTTGRPPVCYEYLCDQILTSRSTGIHRYADNVFSKLIPHLGKRAYKGKHLVEISEAKDLSRVKHASFENRLKESEAAFQAIRLFHENNFLSPQNLKALEKIAPPVESGLQKGL